MKNLFESGLVRRKVREDNSKMSAIFHINMEHVLSELREHHERKERIVQRQMQEINDELRDIVQNMTLSELKLWGEWQHRRNLKENILSRVKITPS